MGLQTQSDRAVFVNISEGRLYTKGKGENPEYFESLTGTITKVSFKTEEYQGKTYEKCEVWMKDGDENFCLGIRVESGYYRGFVNSLKTGDPTKEIKISPNSKTVNDRPQTTIFVQQNGKPLKHAYTKDNPGDLPQIVPVTFKGQTMWDSTEQTAFWKNWLTSIEFNQQPKRYVASQTTEVPLGINQENEDPGDLPF